MPTVNVPSCPICQRTHDLSVRLGIDLDSTVFVGTCPTTGDLFQVTIQRSVTTAPLPQYAKLHQGMMPIFA